MKPSLGEYSNAINYPNFFKKLDMDLIHSFHYGPDYSEALNAKIAGIPWVYTKKYELGW